MKTGLECDEKFYSIEEGKCIDVTVPGAIPNWFGAPAVKYDHFMNNYEEHDRKPQIEASPPY